jgi:biotin synthase
MNQIDTIIGKSLDDGELTADEIAKLFEIPLFSDESTRIQAASRRKCREACSGLSEVHGQVGLNLAPCPRNCLFCAFAERNKVFRESKELTAEEAVEKSLQFESGGANAVFIMTTANYSFSKFAEMSTEIRDALKPETVIIANIGDFTEKQAVRLRDIGYSGIYHAVRLGEGRDTSLEPERRLQTFRNAREAGLCLGTCLEPVGTEHTVEELVEKTLITRDANPVYSGSARRIPIPGTKMERLGIVSEARMAHILAVVRLSLPKSVPGNCTHEPNVIGAAAGANLLWAESGSNPRDTAEKTEEQRGMTVEECRTVLKEAEWDVLDGPSLFYKNAELQSALK